MTLSNALSNAFSGLSSASRSADIVSNNVANALTEDYSRQEVNLTARTYGSKGAGVVITGISRSTNPVITFAKRMAEATLATNQVESSALDRLATALGQPGDPGALATGFTSLTTALRRLQSMPNSSAIQGNLLSAIRNLASGFHQVSGEARTIRLDADKSISTQVQTLNQSLEKIDKLNTEIHLLSISGQNSAALMDKRESLVDQVNSIIPVKQALSNNGEIVLFSRGGEILLNGSASVLEFAETPLMTPEMTIASGALSSLTINGKVVDIGIEDGALEGGSLAAQFRIRDTIIPNFQKQLDALAGNLIDRFQNPALDTTIAAGMAGLFTDNGAVFVAANESSISSRISVNPIVDPSAGGELWRLRDGLGAAAEGITGDVSLISRMVSAMNSRQTASANMGISQPMSLFGFSSEFTSIWAGVADRGQNDLSYNRAHFESLKQEELKSTGVDTDREMQDLLVVEQAYAANSRVLSVIDGLMKNLLEI